MIDVVPLATGDPAPDFVTRNQSGQPVSLEGLRGELVVLVFYPWAFSGICTSELGALRDAYAELETAGARLLAVSCDAMFTLRAYAEAEGLPFDLLTDHWPHGEIAQAYGVFDDEAGCALRGTFVIDRDSRVAWSVVNGIGEPREIRELLAELAQ